MGAIKSGFQLHLLSLHIISGVKDIIPGGKGEARGVFHPLILIEKIDIPAR
jgi:hypothetical protein